MPGVKGHDEGACGLHGHITSNTFSVRMEEYAPSRLSIYPETFNQFRFRNFTLDFVNMSKKGLGGSHFRILHKSGWTIPDLVKAYQELVIDTNFSIDGCASFYHLFLDHYEITEKLGPIAKRDCEHSQVSYNDNTYDLKAFQTFLYASYANDQVGVADYYAELLNRMPDNLLPFGRYPGLRPNWKDTVRGYTSRPHDGHKLFTPEDMNLMVKEANERFVKQYPEIVEHLGRLWY